ncbi:reverse transcriptase [Gossypium australe]|uniref:Reverse transcriptase n=1 Tax=Gossypium australe TaxID=47621 RepID=A0A5B6VLA3_9ROSI|nr:reverse transcriptase [Gossypium australe]
MLDGVRKRISDNDHLMLIETYTEEEIVLNGSKVLDSLYITNIVLILKIPHPLNLKNFSPISLCTVLYKLIVKMIANRFQWVLEGCIDSAQSAFVLGRLISDNILVAYEVLYSFKQKRLGKKGSMALKVDMSKAYYRVEWNFLRAMIEHIDFAMSWIGLIMRCMSSVSYSIIVNSKVGASPRASIDEGLLVLMNEVLNGGLLKGIKVSRGGPLITHLLFTDNCMLFVHKLREVNSFFQLKCGQRGQVSIYGALGVRYPNDSKRYLGLPNMVGRSKKLAFQILKDRFEYRIDSWRIRFLSQGDKEVFIKAGL